MINTLEGINSRMLVKTWINDLEDIMAETSAMEQNEKNEEN